jgi:uncharacterized Zn-binding protein involved in type VI secretion
MASVGIHPPKTPVTKGSHTVAKATIPNVCKMPGPPAPFVPTPLPNVAKSELSPKGYSTTVKIEGNTVAIRGATFESIGDMASKGTGGGLISANTHGPAKFITPGSLTVKIEGKSVHLLGEPMLNNCGPSGRPPNTGASMMGGEGGGGADHDGTEKPKVCPPHGPEKPVDGDHDKEIKEQKDRVKQSQQDVAKARQSHAEAQEALKKPPEGARMSTLRQKEAQARNAISAAEHRLKMLEEKLKSLEFEKKVADDVGGKNVKLICALCGADMGDLDVVASDKAKEAKASASGFKKEKNQFERYKKLVEVGNIVGAGHTMEVAVPASEVPQVEADNPELKGKVQGH